MAEGKEKHHCVVTSCAPPTGDLTHNPGLCPHWELNLQPFGLQASPQSTEPHQPGWRWAYFHLPDYLFIVGEMSSQVLCPFLNWIIFLTLEFLRILSIFWILIPYQICDLQIFSYIPWIDFSLCCNVLWWSKFLGLMKSNLSTFTFIACEVGAISKKSLPSPMPWSFTPILFEDFLYSFSSSLPVCGAF